MSPLELVPPSDAVHTRTCVLWYDRLFYGVFVDGAEVSGDDARENLAVILRLVKGHRAPVMVDLRRIRSQSAEARSVFAGHEATRVTLALALLIDSPISRVLGNFYLGFNKPQTPSRLFNSVREADAWLRTFLEPEPTGD